MLTQSYISVQKPYHPIPTPMTWGRGERGIYQNTCKKLNLLLKVMSVSFGSIQKATRQHSLKKKPETVTNLTLFILLGNQCKLYQKCVLVSDAQESPPLERGRTVFTWSWCIHISALSSRWQHIWWQGSVDQQPAMKCLFNAFFPLLIRRLITITDKYIWHKKKPSF